MGLIRWLTKNWANTTEPTHTDLGPLDLPLTIDKAIPAVETAVASLRWWRVESDDRVAGTVHLTRRTTVFQFVDDVRLMFEATPEGCRVHAASRSRVGVGDLGQNRRNILELWAALKRPRA